MDWFDIPSIEVYIFSNKHCGPLLQYECNSYFVSNQVYIRQILWHKPYTPLLFDAFNIKHTICLCCGQKQAKILIK